ncbi:hypothetical protein GJU40_08320 [Bacillus lacus]|uniref:NlpC/P60 domain-containing protein n=1 Tax=Metabacillus lacus TaxID=1983721 RepID=A0A7X2LZW3_9BACI|nr:NlpC/P60 family protein [Metabacillus lacus]MRX72154.1 hypothetical protein [Metabacillus lacus]
MKRPIIALGVASSLLFGSFIPTVTQASSVSYENSLINISKQYIGVPYKWGGTTPSGFDCSGFIQYVFNKVGIQLPRTTGEMFSSSKMTSVSKKQVGDIVFFATTSKPTVSHAGIYIGNNQFIHASSSRGITISSLSESYWNSRYLGTKRHNAGGAVLAASSENLVQSSKELWSKYENRYSSVSNINGQDQNLLKEYNSIKSKITSSTPAEANEFLLRSARMIDSVKVGQELDSKLNSFRQQLINDQTMNPSTSALYDQFSDDIRKAESVVSRIYGPDNRKVFNDRFVTPAKIAKETVIYEVSIYRLLDRIEGFVNADNKQAAIEHFAMLERLEKRAASIKADGNALHSGQYQSLPKMNQQFETKKAELNTRINNM